MPDPFSLLALTTELHAAAGDPRRWPPAWNALCQWFACPEHYGCAGTGVATGEPDAVAAFCRQAQECAESASGRCGNDSADGS